MWLDGLSAALDILEEDFEIHKDNIKDRFNGELGWMGADFVLGWGAFGSLVDLFIQKASFKKKGLCIAGNVNKSDTMNNYDVLFYETNWVRDFLDLKTHPNIVKAFGINSDIYNQPDMPFPVIYDYIGVGALADWKRWDKMTEKPGRKLVIGEYQDGNVAESSRIANHLLQNGVGVNPMINPFDLAMLYHVSRTAYIPSTIYGGGERAVLEARACGLRVEIESDNPKLQELLDLPEVPDHKRYAEQLKKGILSCLK